MPRALGQRHECTRYPHGLDAVAFSGVHDFVERLIERAAPQRNQYTRRSVDIHDE
jgi:hypothetical protein